MRSLWLPLVLAGVAILFCFGFYHREANKIRANHLRLTDARVEMFATVITDATRDVANDLWLLASGDGFIDYLESGKNADLARTVRRASFLARQSDSYDQLRYLDETGREVFRVGRDGSAMPADELQDKSSRDYFQKAASLTPGEMYVSAFDLNMEHGELERPLKPIWRFAVPVFDKSGAHRGAVVINYLGSALLEKLQKLRPDLAGQTRLLNANGFWIKGPDPSVEWGFMFPERARDTMAVQDATDWKAISEGHDGNTFNAGSLRAWRRLEIPELVGGRDGRVVMDEPFLVVALEYSGEALDEIVAPLRRQVLVTGVLLVAFVIILGLSIAARIETSRAFRRNERSLAVTLNSIGDAVLATDTNQRVTRMNRVAELMTGWSADEARGRPVGEIFRIINEDTREPAVIPVESVLASGEMRGLANHTALISRDGSEHAIADSAAPIMDGNGAIIGVVMVFRDVAAERAARHELDRFFSLSLDFLCISSADGFFKRVSPAVTDILGWSVEEFLSRPYIEMVHPDDRAATLREVEKQISSGEKVMQFENRYRHKDGGWRVLSWRSAPFGDLMYATARDVSETRRKQEEIEGLNEDLQRQTVRLENANKELEAFSYSVSHDLRAPLRHVNGYVEMLLRDASGTLSERSQRYLRTIAEAGNDMGRLIDDLLSFSRMGRTEMHEEEVDMEALVEDVRDELAPTMSDRRIRWSVEPLPKVRGDRSMLKQVFVNLLGNAVKYTRHRDEAAIAVGCSAGDDGTVEFHVRDNGAGFDMKYADKLFGVFQRLHRADEFEGTGIGLANVQRIIARHGGRTWGEGAVNAGATFHFTLKTSKREAGEAMTL